MDTNALPALAPRTVGQKDELRLEGRDKGGWHQNWFALARSEEVGPEQVIGRDVLGGRILAWRTKAGKLVVVRESKKGRAVAVGKAAVASSEMAELKKGNCVKNLHHAGDRYWNAYKTI